MTSIVKRCDKTGRHTPEARPAKGRSKGAGRPGLGTSRNNVAGQVSPGFDPSTLRLLRFARRQISARWLIAASRRDQGLAPYVDGVTAKDPGWVRPPRAARCSWRVAADVGVHLDEEARRAHYSGTERCGSVWACPVCSSVIRGRRAEEIAVGYRQAAANGWGGFMLTLTVRHQKVLSLEESLDGLISAWGRLLRRKPWQRLRQRVWIVGYVRSVEITHGESGWHPHLHIWLVTGSQINDSQDVAEIQAELAALWQDTVRRGKSGNIVPDIEHGCRLEPATTAGVAGYLAKVQEEGKGLASEIARGDWKEGHNGSLLPFQLLDWLDSRAESLWVEYVNTTRGRRAIVWSKGLRDLLQVGDEKTDQEIIDETDAAPHVFSVEGAVYDQLRRNPQHLADVLTETEEDAVIAATRWGKSPP